MMADNDLISRAAALDAIDGMKPMQGSMEQLAMKALCWAAVKTIQPVDAAPVVHGHWVKMTGMMPPEYHGHYECSECQWHMKGLRNSWTREEELTYCPNCGARMDGERREEDAACRR